MILLDTNLLGRITDSTDPQCAVSRNAVHTLLNRRESLVIFPQNLYEFWSAATRKRGPAPNGQNGLGMTSAQAGQWIRFFQRRFKLLVDLEELPAIWLSLVEKFDVRGTRSYDARLAAAMQCYGVTQILTFNANDFKAFNIVILDPAKI
jgi:predicted nucleic acid-binding protein